MAVSNGRAREAGRFLEDGTVWFLALVLLLGAKAAWAAPPNPTPSDDATNTAGGTGALFSDTSGGENTAFGFNALFHNTEGVQNTAAGRDALATNTKGFGNAAFGGFALMSNTEGAFNTAIGFEALPSNSTATAFDNTAVGAFTLLNNGSGQLNTAIGYGALAGNKTGVSNTAIGYAANVSRGDIANGTAIGANAAVTQSNSIVLGDDRISAIFANVTTITAISDRRRKKDIRALDIDLGLDFIEKLEPVSYRFDNGDETERYGFIAQDLEQALPVSLQDTIERSEPEHGLALIERQTDKDRTYRVSYGELTAPIVKAIQQQQQEIEAERRQNAELRHALAAVKDQIAALTVQNHALRHSIEGLRAQVVAAQ